MEPITDDVVVAKLRELLQTADMETTTERQLRKTLQQQLGVDLSDHKTFIRAEVERHLEQEQGIKEEDETEAVETDEADAEDAVEEDEQKPAKKRKGGGFGTCMLSEPLAAFMEAEIAPRNEVVKKIWAYIRANNLQNPKDKRKIIVDDVLGTFLSSPVNMMSMNKQLTKHIFTKDRFEVEEDEDGSDGEARPKKKRSRSKAGETDAEKKPRKPSKLVRTSDKMADWIGGQQIMSRAQITGFFWEYIKKHDLRDHADKRFVVSDPVLKNLTGEDRFQAFGVQKYLKHHFPDAAQ